MDQDKIEWAIAYDLVSDAQVTAPRVPSLGPHAIRLGRASAISTKTLLPVVLAQGVEP
jgi:hypothetical protein